MLFIEVLAYGVQYILDMIVKKNQKQTKQKIQNSLQRHAWQEGRDFVLLLLKGEVISLRGIWWPLKFSW